MQTFLSLAVLFSSSVFSETQNDSPLRSIHPPARRLASAQGGCDHIVEIFPIALPSCRWLGPESIKYECISTTEVNKTTYSAVGCELGGGVVTNVETVTTGIFGGLDCSSGNTCAIRSVTARVTIPPPQCEGSNAQLTAGLADQIASEDFGANVCFGTFDPIGQRYSCAGDGLVLDTFESGILGDCNSNKLVRVISPSCSPSGTAIAAYTSCVSGQQAPPFPGAYFERNPQSCGSFGDIKQYALGLCYSQTTNVAVRYACNGEKLRETWYSTSDCSAGSAVGSITVPTGSCINGAQTTCFGTSDDNAAEFVGGTVISAKLYTDPLCEGTNVKAVYQDGTVFQYGFVGLVQLVCNDDVVSEVKDGVLGSSYSANQCVDLGEFGSDVVGKSADGTVVGTYAKFKKCGKSERSAAGMAKRGSDDG